MGLVRWQRQELKGNLSQGFGFLLNSHLSSLLVLEGADCPLSFPHPFEAELS